MPGGDGTGPLGMGQMTGRGAGYCSGAKGRGLGLGRGPGRGMRRTFFYNDKNALNYEKDILEKQLDQVNEQLKKIVDDK